MRIWTLALALAAAGLLGAPALAADMTVVELGGIKAKAPEAWKFVEPKNPPNFKSRIYQATLPKAEGDEKEPELIVFYFEGGSGTIEQNIKRQQAKFAPPEGKKIDDVTKVEK